ncbi:MAG: hypothetical protein KGJ13_11440 [Patescibacteria group bacterium]|nr:hypothetical protein [Patescibacteria group bacterium]
MSIEHYLIRSLDANDWPGLNAVVQDANADAELSDTQQALIRKCASNRIALLNAATAGPQKGRW